MKQIIDHWFRVVCVATVMMWSQSARTGIGAEEDRQFRIATFSADVTIPLDHRCMGVLPTKSKSIADRLFAKGFVLTGGQRPVVYVAVDWCEIRNGAYDQWRDALAKAAGTDRECVLVSSIHQHDAPVTDLGAARILEEVGLRGELYDETFHDQVVARVAKSLTDSLADSQPLTHIGTSAARVQKVASNRRVVLEDGKVSFGRGSRSGSSSFHRDAPDGQIDPLLRTLSFWNQEKLIAALHVYATHPMSVYGQGQVSSDFVGLARERLAKETPGVHQIYASGCSGDVTAGRYNDGSTQTRQALIDRIYAAMKQSLEKVDRQPLVSIKFRNTQLKLPFHPSSALTVEALTKAVRDEQRTVEDRILAAMGLSSRQRVASGQAIDFPCVEMGDALLVLFPGESFVGYQLMAQQMVPDKFVLSAGYGECWPGYIPTRHAFDDNFEDKWLWAGPGSEAVMRKGLEQLLPED